MKAARKEFHYGDIPVVLETGRIARQATGAVMISMKDTVVLAACVAAKEAKPDRDFFPLTVDYQEKTYAAGKIPRRFFQAGGPALGERSADLPVDRSAGAPPVSQGFQE